jgi:fibronectin-binding autotransporter adhesin
LQLGYSSTGNPITGGTGMVTVAGGQFLMTNDVANIGSRGPGTLTVSGGTATFALLSLGEVAGVQGIVSLTGGQLITVPGTVPVSPFTNIFRVGNLGSGELDISGGAAVIMTALSIADNAGASGLVSLTGGQLFSTNGLSSIGKYGLGQMTVSNATATLTNVSVGRHDTADGTLTVQSNGNFFALDDLSIGRFTNSVGHVFITGGLLSLTNDNLWVGREGTGDLTVSSGTVHAKGMFVGMSEDNTNTPTGTFALTGGTTLLSSNLMIGTSLLSTGRVTVAGGNLTLTNVGGTATLALAQGTFTFNSGNVTADNVLITNSGGQFTFNGGNLQAKNLTVANGVLFTVGDGVNPATLQMQGGTFNFADGLVISANATVIGCGTVIGPIVNNGTYLNSCGGSSPSPTTIATVSRSSNTTMLSCASQNGSSYTLEYKNSLTDPVWTPILPAIPGTGSSLNLTDVAATNSSRFYRVRVQ